MAFGVFLSCSSAVLHPCFMKLTWGKNKKQNAYSTHLFCTAASLALRASGLLVAAPLNTARNRLHSQSQLGTRSARIQGEHANSRSQTSVLPICEKLAETNSTTTQVTFLGSKMSCVTLIKKYPPPRLINQKLSISLKRGLFVLCH